MSRSEARFVCPLRLREGAFETAARRQLLTADGGCRARKSEAADGCYTDTRSRGGSRSIYGHEKQGRKHVNKGTRDVLTSRPWPRCRTRGHASRLETASTPKVVVVGSKTCPHHGQRHARRVLIVGSDRPHPRCRQQCLSSSSASIRVRICSFHRPRGTLDAGARCGNTLRRSY